MNPLTCALTFIMACTPAAPAKPNKALAGAALNLATTAAAFRDTQTTQRLFDLCRIYAGCNAARLENNPLARPFQSNGRPLAYVSTGVYVVGVSLLAGKMRRSNHAFLRRTWWLPQVALVAGHIFAAHGNTSLFNQKLAECGRGCAMALGIAK